MNLRKKKQCMYYILFLKKIEIILLILQIHIQSQTTMNVTLSREQMRLQKAKAQQMKHAAHLAREKAWLAEHPEVAEAREREKQAEAEKRRQAWLDSEAKRKLLSQEASKKKPSNAFAALLSDDESNEDEAPEEIKTPVEPEPEVKPQEPPQQKSVRGAKMSWADECDSDNEA